MWADLSRVLSLWSTRKRALWGGLGIAMLSALSGVALMTLAGKGVAAGIAGGAGMLGVAALLWLRPFVIIRPALRWWERMASHDAAFRALADTRVWFFRRLAERMPGGIGHAGSGDLLGRLVSDVDALDRFYLGAIVPAAGGLAAVLAIALLLGAEPGLLLLVALPLAVALVLPLALAPATARAAQRAAEARGGLRAAAVDPLAGLEDTLAANAEGRAAQRLAEADRAMMAAQRRLVARGAWAGAAGQLLTQCALIGGLAWGLMAGGPKEGEGAALAVLALFLGIAAAEMLGLMPRAGSALAAAGAGARRLFEAADTTPPVAEPAAPAPLPEASDIVFERVSFAWSPKAPPVLTELDLTIRAGEHIAILGPSGVGKSSLAALLLRLAAPTAGRITLGGVDIAHVEGASLRTRVVALSQNARLFDDTIANNLRLAAPEAPEAALWRALARAGVGEFVRGLPEGLETICGEGGQRFSGGEARRIALARALLPPASVLILDEPTAGLDQEAAKAFLATLAVAAEGRTLILLTHELSGVEPLDRVFRLAGGRLLPAAG